MIPTPEQVVPLIVPAVPDLRDALRSGIDHADDLQPDPADRDPWYWSHSARWRAVNKLRSADAAGWTLTPRVPNCGIHLRFGELHVARVLRSLGGSTPPPGSNRARRDAWAGVQGVLALADDGVLPPLSPVIDWHESQGEPELHIGLPIRPWSYGRTTRLHWRIELPEGGVDLSALAFEPRPDSGEGLISLNIDESETGSDDR